MKAARKKKRQQPYVPPTTWDAGPNTVEQRRLKVLEQVDWTDPVTGEKSNPNGVKRARRIDLVELYHRKGILDRSQFLAASILRRAYEATHRSAPSIKAIQVDASPKPDHFIAIIIDRASRFSNVMGMVPAQDREIVDCVVLRDRIPAHLPRYRGRAYSAGIVRMREALTDLARRLDV